MNKWKIFGKVSKLDANLSIADDRSIYSQICSPEIAWDSASIAWKHKTDSPTVVAELLPWYVLFDAEYSRISISRYLNGNLFKAWDYDFTKTEFAKIKITADQNKITIQIGNDTLEFTSQTTTRITTARLYLEPKTIFTPPLLNAVEIPDPCAKIFEQHKNSKSSTEVTVDFFDDMIPTPFDKSKLDKMFEVIANLGAKNAYWIDHGKRDSGFWDHCPIPILHTHMIETFESLGDDFLASAVKSAHKSNVKLTGIFKPFDTAICNRTEPIPNNATPANSLGGNLINAFKFPKKHPEFCMKRRSIPTIAKSIAKIIIASRKAIPTTLSEKIKIFVSDDNASYRPYDQKIKIETTANTITLSSLNIENKFTAIQFPQELAANINNTLDNLITVINPQGEKSEFTYGLIERSKLVTKNHLKRETLHLDFTKNGINFDNAGTGIPSVIWNNNVSKWQIFSPEPNQHFLAIAMDVNHVSPAMLSEAHPESHDFWLRHITNMLQAGVDAVELRITNHGNIIDWSKFGFNGPIVEEYKKRFNIDITKENYDIEKLQTIRGDFFTEFLHKASKLTRDAGKKFRMHIPDPFHGSAAEPAPMGLHLQWQRWIDEKICDGISLKAINGSTHLSAVGRDVIAACKQNNMPVNYTPFTQCILGVLNDSELLKAFEELPFDAFNVYEFASIYDFKNDGSVNRLASQDQIDWLKKI